MYTEQEIRNIIEYWERRIIYRPFYRGNGEKYECSRIDDDKPKLPWELEENADKRVVYNVYLGNYSVSDLVESVYKNRDKTISSDEKEKHEGKYCNLCMFRVDTQGKFVKNSFKLVPFMYVIGALYRSMTTDMPANEVQIRKKNRDFCDQLEQLGELGKINFEALEKLDHEALNAAGVSISDVKSRSSNITTVYITETDIVPQVQKKKPRRESAAREKRIHNKAHDDEKDTLSFLMPESRNITREMERVIHEGNCKNLDNLLDLFENGGTKPGYNEFVGILNPINSPIGAWLGADRLDILQQFAMNAIFRDDDKIKLINAPAGTDRISLIKNTAAWQIIRKARFLADFENPDDLFKPMVENDTSYYAVPRALIETEMMVLSENDRKANNLAFSMVNSKNENHILHGSIKDRSYIKEEDIYYTKAAKTLFNSDDVWGMPVIYIGDQKYMETAVNAMTNDVGSIRSNYHTKKLLDFFVFISMKEMSEATFRQMSADHEWERIRNEYKTLYDDSVANKETLGVDMAALAKAPEYTFNELCETLDELDEEDDQHDIRKEELEAKLEASMKEKDEADEQADELYETMTGKEQRQYMKLKTPACMKYNRLIKKSETLEREIDRMQDELDDIAKDLRESDEKRKYIQFKLDDAKKFDDHLKKIKSETMAAYPRTAVPDFYDLRSIYDYVYHDAEKLDVSKAILQQSPMMTPEAFEASEEMLYNALKLIKNFVRSSEKAKENINLMLEKIISGGVADMSTEMFDSLFASFQLMVPVISISKENTRLFLPQATGHLGLVLIADAGSWNTEDTFTLLSKADRLVAIGDLDSEQPEDYLPDFLENALIAGSKLPEGFTENGSSFFSLACRDRSSISAQLLFSHNCGIEVFNFINKGYNNRLVSLRTPHGAKYAVERTCFMDVGGRAASKNSYYVEEQGKVVLSLLNSAIRIYGINFFRTPNTDLVIASPYKSVVDGLKSILTTKLLSVLPSVSSMFRSGILTAERLSKFLFNFKNNNIITMDEYNAFDSPRELILVLGCDRHSYIYYETGRDLKLFNKVFSSVRGHIAVIGSKDVWGDTAFYKNLEESFEIITVEK